MDFIGETRAARECPEFSVVIPCYGVARFIAGCLDSVFAQTFRDFEVIVVNDGSPDTAEFELALAPYRDHIRYVKRENGGVSAARNSALRAARGRWIAGIDPDDLWEPHYLETQYRYLSSGLLADVLYGDAIQFGDDPRYAGRRLMQQVPSQGEVTFESLIRQHCNVLAVTAVARREALIAAGMFDETLRTGEDYELWLRVLKTGGRIAYHREAIARYRRRHDSLTADPTLVLAQYLNILAKAQRMPALTGPETQAIADQIRFVKASLEKEKGRKAFAEGDHRAATAHLKAANIYFRSPRLTVIRFLIALAPWLLTLLERQRQRRLRPA